MGRNAAVAHASEEINEADYCGEQQGAEQDSGAGTGAVLVAIVTDGVARRRLNTVSVRAKRGGAARIGGHGQSSSGRTTTRRTTNGFRQCA